MIGHLRSRILVIAACLVFPRAFADPPQRLERTDESRAAEIKSGNWIEIIEQEVPPLQNDPGDRLPMIMWHSVGFQPLTDEELTVLRERGLCQHLQLSESMIPSAKKLVEAGMPVILMEGRTDNWPYSLTQNPDDWAHQFDATYQQPWFGKEDASEWHGACPNHVDGWKKLADNTRDLLTKYRDAGVRVDGVLVDYEGDPYPWPHLFEQLQHCKRCRQELPDLIHDKSAWQDFAWQKYVALYDEHFAKPIREVFPDALVTNWHVVYSTPDHPVRYFVTDTQLPALAPKHFSATNPIAYASDLVWQQLWDASQPLTQDSVDTFYTHQILHQVTDDKLNREAAGAVDVRSIPWVARACRIADNEQSPAPMMSRSRYREALGQVWESGIETMQIFNAMHDGYEELSIMELQDAVAAYDVMLEKKSGDHP